MSLVHQARRRDEGIPSILARLGQWVSVQLRGTVDLELAEDG